MNLLSGYKTYICGTVAIFVIGLEAAGIITPEVKATLLEMCGAMGVMALRAGMKKT